MNVEDKASLYDALSAAKKVARFVHDVDRKAFQSNEEKCSAVYGQLAILGEACTRLSPDIRTRYGNVPGDRSSACGIASSTATMK